MHALLIVGALSTAFAVDRAQICAICHTNLAGGNGPYALWANSMMSRASRDPYWRARVASEISQTPLAAAAIEAKCVSCHAPLQQGPKRIADMDRFGDNGVNCIACHHLTAAGEPSPEPVAYGPHDRPFAMPMRMHTGYEPAHGPHVMESAFCATCHTVITPTISAKGQVTGEFVEQAPYLEWQASEWPKNGISCQSCHVPQTKDPEYIAHRPPGGPFPPTQPRAPFGRHVFTGANAQMLGILNLPAGRERTVEFLESAADLVVSGTLEKGRLVLSAEIANITGHKLPTGYPGRRMWLHVTATDGSGRRVFESGAAPPAAQPHHQTIERPGQVMLYEARLADSAGKPTDSLVRAAGFAHDNRILPRGFTLSRSARPSAIQPVGVVADRDFVPGSDRVRYIVRGGSAPYYVEVRLLYDALGRDFRHTQPPVSMAATELTVAP
jgi:hypothetical protein